MSQLTTEKNKASMKAVIDQHLSPSRKILCAKVFSNYVTMCQSTPPSSERELYDICKNAINAAYFNDVKHLFESMFNEAKKQQQFTSGHEVPRVSASPLRKQSSTLTRNGNQQYLGAMTNDLDLESLLKFAESLMEN